MNKASRGFTLIEVMVALFVVAMAVSALMLKMMSLVDNTAYLESKTVASWVAMNQLELERLANQHTNQLLTDEKTGQETMVGRDWYWRIKPIKTANNGFIQLQVSVSLSADVSDPVVTMTTLADRYHQQ